MRILARRQEARLYITDPALENELSVPRAPHRYLRWSDRVQKNILHDAAQDI